MGPAPAELPSTVRWVKGDVSDPHAIEAVLRQASAAIHLAFRMDLDAEDPVASVRTNLLGSTLVFDEAARLGLRRVVWGSSVMVYGPRERYPSGPVDEKAEPMPRTPYGASKLLLEWLAKAYGQRGLEAVGLRFTTVFGPGRKRLGAAGFCVTAFEGPAAGVQVQLHEGDRSANLLYVEDAARACVEATLSTNRLAGVYNVGGFESSVAGVADAVKVRFPAADLLVEPGGESRWPTAIDCAAAARDFGYEPRFDLERSVDAYLSALGCSPVPEPNHRAR
jgi:nucleoside-diphosphate-sugar epimerase